MHNLLSIYLAEILAKLCMCMLHVAGIYRRIYHHECYFGVTFIIDKR